MMCRKFVSCCFVLGLMGIASCKRSHQLFTALPASETHIEFENHPLEKDAFGILYYLYYYNGGGVATGDINNDGLTDIYFTANRPGGNKLYLNKGNLQFEDVTETAGVEGTADWCTGVTMADVNGDGLLDMYVSAVANDRGLKGQNQLFINQSKGNNISFKESAEAYGLNFSGFSTQAAFFDMDHDGDLDCYVLNQSHRPNENITDTSKRRKYDPNSGDRLYRNTGKDSGFRFTDVSAQSGIYQSSLGYGLGLAIADLNNDGWDDIYVGNDFHENDYYYINKGNGQFEESGAAHFKHYSRFSMGNDVADYNNDGQPDLVTVDMLPPDEKTVKTYGSDENPDIYKFKLINNGFQYQYSRNCLQRNNGNGSSFSETALMSGISATDWSWAPLFADYDNDGNKDLLITSGIVKRPVDMDYVRYISSLYMQKAMNQSNNLDQQALEKMPDGASHPFLFKGDGNNHFTDSSIDWGTGKMKGYFNGAAYADLDNDGDLDLVISSLGAKALIMQNNAPAKNYLSIQCSGNDGNTFGVGAKAYLFEHGHLQYQELMPTRGFESSCEPRLHFGLDTRASIDSILIVWPNQQYQVIAHPAINQLLKVDQRNAANGFRYVEFFPPITSGFEDISTSTGITWKHQEDPFVDFNQQYLLPHLQSTRGPAAAVADVNGDGLDDLFMGGGVGQSPVLFLQQKNGHFIPSDTALMGTIGNSEVTGAVFFDADGDGDKDLYTCTGGNEFAEGDDRLRDHLFLNQGNGHFADASAQIPLERSNKSCVVSADIDKDGDIDLFVGGALLAKKYGFPASSHVLINDGKGRFTLASETQIPLKELGMVTTAAFADMNGDGYPELIVTGEWMPLLIFQNNKGSFTSTAIPASTGLWQSLLVTDVNGDGKNDLLCGNWGQNSKLYAGKTSPLKLYVKDFDNNGSVEQIMTYNIGKESFTFLAKDELERSLPVLKKAYLTYGEVAGKTVDYLFFDLFKNYRELQAEILSSSVFINQGNTNFSRQDLPSDLQLAPIFSFVNSTQPNQYLAAGNFYGVVPYEGRYDALLPTQFSFSKNGEINDQLRIPFADGEVRGMHWMKRSDGKMILAVAINNAAPVFLQPN